MKNKLTKCWNKLKKLIATRSKAEREAQRLYHWSIWVPLAVGVGMILSAFLAPLGEGVYSNLLCTFGSLLFSVGLIGLLLNALWWRSWAVKAILEIFSKRELIAKLHLDKEEMRKRFYAMIGAVYGTSLPSSEFTSAFDMNVLERLAIPVRRNLELTYDLRICSLEVESEEVEVARLWRATKYVLHNYSYTSSEPFKNGLITSGFVDIPEVIIKVWKKSILGGNLSNVEANENVLEEINEEHKVFCFEKLSINGEDLEKDTNYTVKLSFDGSKREPQIAYQVLLEKDTAEKLKLQPDQEVQVVFVCSTLHNLQSYLFSMQNQLTEGATFHFSWNDSSFDGTMRYIMPPYWTNQERKLVQVGPGQLILHVNTMLFPGHASLVSWQPPRDQNQEIGE